MLKDRVRFSKTTRGLGVQCLYCGSYDHSYISCPNVTPSPNKPLCLARHNYSQEETKRSEKVRLRTKSNSILNCKILNKSIQFYLHYKQFQDNLQNIDGCTDETAEVVQARKGSNFSCNGATAMRYHDFHSTSILLATDQGTTPIQHNGSDPITPRQRSFSETNSEESYLPVAKRQSFQKPKKEYFQSHSGIRYNRRNLTNIAEERSAVDINTNNSATFQSQLVSTMNFAGFDNKLENNTSQFNNSTDQNNNTVSWVQHNHLKKNKLYENSALFNSNNRDIFDGTKIIQRRIQKGGRNRTWNGIQVPQANDESTSQNQSERPYTSKQDPQAYHSNSKTDKINSQLIYSPHNDISYLSNCIPSNTFQSNNNLVNIFNQNMPPSSRSTKLISQDLIPRGSNTHIVQERKSSFTPRNNVGGSFINQSNGHPQSQTQLPVKQQSLNLGSQTSALNVLNNNNQYQNQHSYGLSNSDMNNQHRNCNNNDQKDQQSETIAIHSIRNIQANNNWEDDVMNKFDRFKIFKQYFPYNNIDKVLLRFNGAYFLILKKQQINQKRASLKKQIFLLRKKSILEGGLNSSKHSGHKKQSLTTNALDLGQLVLNKSDNKKQINIVDPTRQSLSNIINNLSSYSAAKESRLNIAQQTNKTISLEQLTLTQGHSKEESLSIQ